MRLQPRDGFVISLDPDGWSCCCETQKVTGVRKQPTLGPAAMCRELAEPFGRVYGSEDAPKATHLAELYRDNLVSEADAVARLAAEFPGYSAETCPTDSCTAARHRTAGR